MTTKTFFPPWKAVFDDGRIFIYDSNHNVVALLDYKSQTREARELDAALIARAPELLAENEALKVRIAELEAAQKWQPIETAPKDWTVLLVMDRGDVSVACHDTKKWVALADGKMRVSAIEYTEYDDFLELNPTHWMPLPKMEGE